MSGLLFTPSFSFGPTSLREGGAFHRRKRHQTTGTEGWYPPLQRTGAPTRGIGLLPHLALSADCQRRHSAGKTVSSPTKTAARMTAIRAAYGSKPRIRGNLYSIGILKYGITGWNSLPEIHPHPGRSPGPRQWPTPPKTAPGAYLRRRTPPGAPVA